MGKFIGAFIGLLTFGPAGLIIGLFLGFLFDSNVKLNFFSQNSDFSYREITDSFPILAAEIINAGNLNKFSILNLKNIVIGTFGTNNAKTIMSKIKYYIENGYTQYKVDEVCEIIYSNFDLQTKINIINLLFAIIKSNNSFTSEEMNKLNSIASKIGVTINNFNDNTANAYGFGYEHDYGFKQRSNDVEQKDYYKILNIDHNASNDEIKRQYRTLCKKYHPDKSVNLSENEKKSNETKMKEIIGAYEEVKKERNIK